jgi:hypothetical protein
MKFLARQKLRYDLGAGFMSMATFSAALLAASDKIAGRLGVAPATVMVFGVPAVILSVWLLGYLLDRFRFYNSYQDEMNLRNEKLMEALKK